MNKIKVLHVGKYYYPYRGGLESGLYTFINELKDKLEIQILVSNTKCKTVIEKDSNLTIIRLANFGKIFSQPITPTLFFWIKRLKADIVHLHLPNPLAMVFYLIIRPPGKLLISYHADIVKQKIAMIFLKPLLIRLLQKADAIVVSSNNLIILSPMLKEFRAKCHIIPYGIDINKFEATPWIQEESGKIKSTINKPILLFVGRLVYYKGLKYLIRAMKNINAKLIIIGDGPLRFKLRIWAKLLGVNHKILWLGEVSEKMLPVYYHTCDLFVLPSCYNSESFGIVQLEAFACRKPVVSTALPTGVTFVNLNDQTGLSVAPRNYRALADAINRLLESPQLCKIYGQNGRERVEKEFNKEKIAQKLLKVCEGIL